MTDGGTGTRPGVPRGAREDDRGVSRQDVDRWWHRHRWLGDPEARERLILHHAPLVRHVVRRVAASMPVGVDRADLHSHGILGLIEAIERHDPDGDRPFEAYATHRIRGAILDGLRALDWVPRSVRRDERSVRDATTHLEAERRVTPTDEDVARWLGWELGRVVRASNARGRLRDAGSTRDGDDGMRAIAETLEDLHSLGPAEVLEDRELQGRLRMAVQTLTDLERSVLILHYHRGLTLHEVGAALDVPVARVWQAHASGLTGLRSRLGREV